MRARKEILDLRFTITLVKWSPGTDRNTWEDEMIRTQQIVLVRKDKWVRTPGVFKNDGRVRTPDFFRNGEWNEIKQCVGLKN